MSVERLKPVTLPKPDVSNHDRIVAALTQALKDQQEDQKLQRSAAGVAVIWFHQHDDGTFGESWIIQGLNALEAIGLMNMTANDITLYGLGPGDKRILSDDDPYDDGASA